SDGLATFLSTGMVRLYRLPRTLMDRLVVGPRFQVRPLLGWLAEDGRFFMLAFSQNKVRLLDATARAVRRVDVPGLPASMAEAMRTHDRDEPLNLHTHPAGMRGPMQAISHGQGVGIDDHKAELLRYCQEIDQAVRTALNQSHALLVLATVEYLAAIYRQASHYPHLCGEIIKGNPDRLSDQELHDRA